MIGRGVVAAAAVMVAGCAAGDEVQAAGAQEAGASEREAVPTEWETLYVAFLEPGSPGPLADTTRERIMDGHVQHQLRLQRLGAAVAAGGVAPVEGSPLVGLTLVRAPSADSARALIQADPAVAAGVFRATVREWWVPAGRLDPPSD